MAWGSRKTVETLWAREGPFDLVDAHYIYPDGYAALRIARLLDVPLVVTARGTDLNVYPDLPGIGRMVRTVLREADALVGVSHALRERMVALGARPEKCHLALNGVDFQSFSHPRIKRENAGVRLLSVGNLVPGKQMDVLLKAVARLTAEGRDLELTIVGEGPERDRLQNLANEGGVPERVRLLGRISHDEMGAVYAEADLFCLASRSEGCPNVVLEALASGLPVVAAPVGGIPELVRDGENGVLAENAGLDAYAAALIRALDRTWDAEAIRRTVGKFSWTATIDTVQRVFAGVVG